MDKPAIDVDKGLAHALHNAVRIERKPHNQQAPSGATPYKEP